MRTVFVWLVLVLTGFQAFAQEYQDSKSLFEAARKLQKPVLLVFSGSDWCVPCIQLKKKVLGDTTFQKYTEANLLVFIADFPQRRKLSSKQTADNEELAVQFNPKGLFPHAVLLRSDQTLLKILDVSHPSVDSWIKSFEETLSQP